MTRYRIVPETATDRMVSHAEGFTDFILPDGVAPNTAERRREEMRVGLRAAMDAAPDPLDDGELVEWVARQRNPTLWEAADRRMARLGARDEAEHAEDYADVYGSDNIKASLADARAILAMFGKG